MGGKLRPLRPSRSTDGSGSPEMLAARKQKEEPRFDREMKLRRWGHSKEVGGQGMLTTLLLKCATIFKTQNKKAGLLLND